ncbi:MAG: hypothetical protein HZA60_08335 [Deltaproteobacteria bacterium]|nr:hypothetical protein [Deltaproteobacteria bacterium]
MDGAGREPRRPAQPGQEVRARAGDNPTLGRAPRRSLGRALPLVGAALLLGAGCAPARYRLAGEEARGAEEFFAAATALSFPIEASYSGVAEFSERVVPFVAGVNSRTPAEETVGFYDSLGRAVLFLAHDGSRVTISPGPAADELPSWYLHGIPDGGVGLEAGPVSFGRILSGAPGYPVNGGQVGRSNDGRWVFEDGRQTLFSDPSRRLLSRAEYEISGRRVTVTYPGRESPGPPPLVTVEISGAKIVLRRDAE